VTDRLGVFLLPKERVIVVSAEQSGAVQFFLITLTLRFFYKSNLAIGTLSLGGLFPILIQTGINSGLLVELEPLYYKGIVNPN